MLSMQKRIEQKLTEEFHPTHLAVVNDSGKHVGHAGDDGSGESHFSIDIVSDKFKNLTKVACHRMLYDVLCFEMKSIHALSIIAKPK